ncbi:O-succinylhomoserine sulfhydrylase [Candidatus Phycosocius spiralis]|uniref:O-succinylhomoserine sulfhydrylase n=1 Tax=Candidatus Phycosocius spiralis TaxID=2815099 RepID=A0ABQ4PUE7_9PROT|nr:O-succinylhomoserine sulfhydrylase [Candidatus Phycosocius spiralis]GIU66598.1 O-succinylhomoserine sulfhydrylase [Candidatus Phycosocius spiralis]
MTDESQEDQSKHMLGLETILVRGGQTRSAHKETSEALFLTSGFVYDSAEEAEARFKGEAPGYLYGRYANPTNTMLQERLRALDGAQACRLTASGMAAVTAALIAPLRCGDHVIAGKALFSSCRWVIETFMPRYGIEVTLVDSTDLAAWKVAIQPNTKMLFLESPSNPTLEISDIEAIAAIAHSAGARLIVDNIFASPILQRPFEHGADVVVYSTTKHMDGAGRTLGGAILGLSSFIEEHIDPYLRHTGPAMSPFVAWNVLKGLETLSMRVERASDSAAKLSDLIANHKAVRAVRYPFRPDHPHYELAKRQMKSGGTLVAFELVGGKKAAFAFLDALKIVDISNNLGDSKSLATHPATTTHYSFAPDVQLDLGVTPGLIRLSVGIEACDDLCRDIAVALDAALTVE